MLTTLAVTNYRSLRNVVVPLQQLNVITGANGSGKSSLYRALRLLSECAQGGVVHSLAREGGLPSTLWAGPETTGKAVKRGEQPVQGTKRKSPVGLLLGFAGDEFGYAIDLGLPRPDVTSAFVLDPEIKRECVWSGPFLRQASLLVDRNGQVFRAKGEGDWNILSQHLSTFDSMMMQSVDPKSTPELIATREQIRSWRFYDHFRTDVDAPARMRQIGTHTPVLGNDGADLAAALQTIMEIGDRQLLEDSIDDAFPGACVSIVASDGRFEVQMQQAGLLRPLRAAELSDGTLRYLLLIAALLTPRPPQLLVLNEPETSLHPDLLPALARLIARAAKNSQVIVVSHATRLVAGLEAEPECNSMMLEKEFGETRIAGLNDLDAPAWYWPTR